MDDLKKILGYVGCAAVVLIFMAVVFVFIGFNRGELSKFQGGSTSGSLCSSIPEPYRSIFDNAGKKFQVQPAFLAAIFSVEHGQPEQYETGYVAIKPADSAWPERSPGDPNKITKWKTSSAGALGPFQFMPKTWEGHKEFVPLRPGTTEPSVQNIQDAAYAAAHMLSGGAGDNTTDQNKLREAAAHYNGGTNPPASSYDDYAVKVLKNYNSYYCQTGGGLLNTITGFITRILNYVARPLMSSPGPKAIVLHWSGGSTLDGLASTLESRNKTEGIICQLGIDKNGDIYQFMNSLDEVPVCQNAWNSHGIGIEIVGVGKADLMNNEAQFQGVCRAVKVLRQKYNIPNINDTANGVGILGHFQINPEKSDPSQEYLNKVINQCPPY